MLSTNIITLQKAYGNRSSYTKNGIMIVSSNFFLLKLLPERFLSQSEALIIIHIISLFVSTYNYLFPKLAWDIYENVHSELTRSDDR